MVLVHVYCICCRRNCAVILAPIMCVCVCLYWVWVWYGCMLVPCAFLYVFFLIWCHFCRANLPLFWQVCFPVAAAGLWVILRLFLYF